MVNEDSLYQKADNLKHLDIISLSEPHLSDPDHEEPQAQLDGKTLISKPKKKQVKVEEWKHTFLPQFLFTEEWI